MKIENVNEQNYINTFPDNPNGKKFTYLDKTDYAYKSDRIFPITKELVEEVLNDITIDLSKLDVPIFFNSRPIDDV